MLKERRQAAFVGDVAHELRTPLTAIRGNAEMLLDPDLPPEMHDKFLSIIIGESERLSRLTNDLLTLKRIESDVMPFELSRVNLGKVCREVLDMLEPILREREANTEVVGEAPDVLGNPDRLKQVVSNLVENASRFIDPGGHIVIELFGLRGNSIVAVKDDGCGFGDVDPALLFDRFYRTDSSRSRDTGGTGLGLAIVKSVVEAHDGTVEAINLSDGGACFIVAACRHPRRRRLSGRRRAARVRRRIGRGTQRTTPRRAKPPATRPRAPAHAHSASTPCRPRRHAAPRVGNSLELERLRAGWYTSMV